jgi:hypothetical protein
MITIIVAIVNDYDRPRWRLQIGDRREGFSELL